MTDPAPSDAPKVGACPWRAASPPRRLLAIRLQAFGDVVITLPYLRALQQMLRPVAKPDCPYCRSHLNLRLVA